MLPYKTFMRRLFKKNLLLQSPAEDSSNVEALHEQYDGMFMEEDLRNLPQKLPLPPPPPCLMCMPGITFSTEGSKKKVLKIKNISFLSFFHWTVSNLFFCCVTVKTIYTQKLEDQKSNRQIESVWTDSSAFLSRHVTEANNLLPRHDMSPKPADQCTSIYEVLVFSWRGG
ncbi:unnamed protein product [Porites evermanni]|uniref:Uncharacterized protein n=1 Tax=Porites evermanni TaxID=104178 RepID=A0ABN8PCT8_9CNID|nr:unnamed protein product [Porites evermanni]